MFISFFGLKIPKNLRFYSKFDSLNHHMKKIRIIYVVIRKYKFKFDAWNHFSIMCIILRDDDDCNNNEEKE